MAKNLLIVESPAKAKTINKYLGKDFTVLASYGHVRDLVPREGAVDPEHGFAMRYETIERSARHVDAIAKAASKAEAVYLATDLDREGEAISWHVQEILHERNLIEDKPVYRVIFSEITPKAIRDAVQNPRKISMDLVNAQQARRALDYLVGFNLSPVLWRKVQRGLSAGRVQSPALRMIVEREEEIKAFISREYWTLAADLAHPAQPFQARLYELDGSKWEQFDLTDEAAATSVRERLKTAAGGSLKVGEITRRQRRRRPAAPFTTSTLQQEASRKLGFGTQRTMRLAQQLYEGVETGDGVEGLITYMRTDSVSLSNDAVAELREVIHREYGEKSLPETPNVYKTKSKNAQEAHEAVRPTSALRLPSQLTAHLNKDQLALYELIWKRTLASQMSPALLNTVSVNLHCGDVGVFRASGSTIVDPGFLAVYEEGRDQKKDDDEDNERRLPEMNTGDSVPLAEITSNQHFTEPPPRFSEASLVKTLEEYGIGRPSTYASIIQTLLAREYVELESRRFTPTDVGSVVSKFLASHFSQYVDYDFTARLEDELDAVSRGEKEWVPLLEAFWAPFRDQVADKLESVDKSEATGARVLGTDPASGKPVSVRLGRYGPFAQIGDREDEEKPRFASLRPGQKMDSLNLEDALQLFKLPRKLGETAEGEPVSIGIGRFGPFVRFGSSYASLGKEDDPYTVGLERALELVAEKKQIEANRIIQKFDDSDVQVLNGRYGPYITNGALNANVPKEQDPAELSLADCEALLESKGKPVRAKRGAKGAKTAKAAKPAKATKSADAAKAPRKAPAKKKPAAKKATTKKKPASKTASAKKTAAGTSKAKRTTGSTASASDATAAG